MNVCMHIGMYIKVQQVNFFYLQGGFAWPMLSDELTKLGISFTCLETGEGFEPKTLTLYRPKTTLVSMCKSATLFYVVNRILCSY